MYILLSQQKKVVATKDKVDENQSSMVYKESELVDGLEDQNQVKQSAVLSSISECTEPPVSHDSHSDKSLEENENYSFNITYMPASSAPDSLSIQNQLSNNNASCDMQGMW